MGGEAVFGGGSIGGGGRRYWEEAILGGGGIGGRQYWGEAVLGDDCSYFSLKYKLGVRSDPLMTGSMTRRFLM